MPIFSSRDVSFAQSARQLAFCNPFLPERIELERKALGEQFLRRDAEFWCKTDNFSKMHPNIAGIVLRAETIVDNAREALIATRPTDGRAGELQLYEDLVLFVLYHRYHARHLEAISACAEFGVKEYSFRFYRDFERDLAHYLAPLGAEKLQSVDAPHLFACFFQLRRAFYFIFEYIVGASMPAARLRAAVWQSTFTHDMQRYRRVLYKMMGDFPSLVIGPSGTGKELVSRAIAFSRYIPFNASTLKFVENFMDGFYPLNLTALSPTLIESELFGHRRGSFTGALEDRVGWLEQCSSYGTVFLDEIGDTDERIQVKLLRVVQNRRFQRIGDRDERQFKGKLIAATNRDLPAAIAAGKFREDFYYRLCADVIRTPSLREQLDESPEALEGLVQFFARRMVGEQEAPSLSAEVMEWISAHLGPGYSWPGNVREVEQCVRGVLIRKSYDPVDQATNGATKVELATHLATCNMTADELLREYCRVVYAETGSLTETAKRLGVDYRTVKSKLG